MTESPLPERTQPLPVNSSSSKTPTKLRVASASPRLRVEPSLSTLEAPPAPTIQTHLPEIGSVPTLNDQSNRRQQAFDFFDSDSSNRPNPKARLLAKLPRVDHEPHLAQARIKFFKPEFRARRIAVSRDDIALILRRKVWRQ